MRLRFKNAFRNVGFGKGADILFPKPEVFLRTEIKVVTAIEEGKRECECGAEQPGPNHLSHVQGEGTEGSPCTVSRKTHT